MKLLHIIKKYVTVSKGLISSVGQLPVPGLIIKNTVLRLIYTITKIYD